MDHGDDIAGARLDHGDRGSALALVLHRDVLRHGVERRGLQIGVEGRADRQATPAQKRLALDLGLAEGRVGLDHPHDEVAEVGGVGRRASVGLDRRLQDIGHLDGLGGGRLDRGDEPALDHLVEHHVAAGLRQVWIAGRVIGRRLLDDPGEGRRFHEVEFARRLREVATRGGLHAVGAGTEVDDVEVLLEDLVLAVATFECQGVANLAQLARRRALACRLEFLLSVSTGHEQVLDVLLRDRRTALDAPGPG